MLPFSAFDPAASTAKVDALSKGHGFGSSVSFRLLQPKSATTLCSPGSQQCVDLTDPVNFVDRFCAYVERAKREVVQPRPRPGGFVFLRTDFLSARFARRFFQRNGLRLSLSSRYFLPKFLPSFFLRVGSSIPNTPRLLHRRRCFLLSCALRGSLSSSLHVPCYLRRRSTVAAGNGFTFFGCMTSSRCCWEAFIVGIHESSHQSTS